MSGVENAPLDAEPAAIRFVEVSKSFGERKRRHLVLDRVSFSVPKGRTTVIAGGSGQGKSVILKLILGLLKPDAGQVLVGDRDIAAMGYRALQEVRMLFGVLFQGVALFDSLTVFENIALPLRERTKLSSEEIRQRVAATLDQLELTGHEEKFPAQLSGGMKKRVGLARALQLDPEIVLFDEPTTGLDPVMTREIYELFTRTQQRLGYTAVIVSHDIPQIFTLADQIILLNKGELDVFSEASRIPYSTKPKIREFARQVMGQEAREG
ncbi:ABC transporter ATP-binding protein [Desulfobulbus elongatus]|uniref:ABC transporter ATP-binding protein n=1 Tax=Desulfobulbus elongatus TaxID=53332 RepID=UPI0006842CD7|nr:ATP-binding cassette domain-containing protein [Desulfobulbus elongatus]